MWILGCGSAVPSGPQEAGSSSTSAGSAESSSTTDDDPTTPNPSSDPTTASSSDPTIDPSTTDDTSPGTSSDTDGSSSSGGLIEWCDTFTQDCPAGQRCVPWANDGGPAWNSTRCVPIVDEPSALGEACTAQGDPATTGFDSCDVGAMCWNIGEDGEGRCVGLCSGSVDDPECVEEDTWCSISAASPLALCLLSCDPVLSEQDCDEGEVCIVANQNSLCAPDASEDGGALGEGCEFTNACDPGLGCVMPLEEHCDPDANGCCLPYCHISAPDCPLGLECLPVFENHETLDDLGLCYEPS